MEEPVTIIGAGPAGLTAAIVLARHGYRTKVYEMAAEVGHRLNGDFQGLENWSSERDVVHLLRDLGIEINFPCTPCYGGTVHAVGMEPVQVRSDRPVFYLVKRGSMPGTLDQGLKEQALSSGAEIVFNKRIENFEGKAIVGTGPKAADAVAVGITFSTAIEDQAVVVLDDAVAPKGYGYLLVHEGCGTMVTVLYTEFRRGKEYFAKMMNFFRNRIKVDIRNEKRFGRHVNFFIRDTQIAHKKIYIGEAAGFQDLLWGFGMRYALLSGYFAAKSLIDGSDYDALWKRGLRPMLETSLVNRYLFEKFGHTGYRYLARKFSRGEPCGFLRKHYNPSFLKQLLLPVARRNYESRGKNRKARRCV